MPSSPHDPIGRCVSRTALLLGLIARDDVGMSADMIRTDALSAAGIILVAIAGGSLLRLKK
jgi:hypothetical protein